MAIENVGSFQKVLDNFSTKDWAKSVDLKTDIEPLNSESNFGPVNKPSFSEMLAQSVNQVNDLQKEANVAIQKLVTGESKNLHETLLMAEKADMAFRQMNQIRMKVIDAYREVMKMQV